MFLTNVYKIAQTQIWLVFVIYANEKEENYEKGE